jgi:hypothetical protein
VPRSVILLESPLIGGETKRRLLKKRKNKIVQQVVL